MVDGTCHDTAKPLRDLLEQNLADGLDTGASVALVQDGEVVADLWGGEARPGVPWTRDTVVQVWSVTKAMAALAVMVLVERGELDLDAPAATYWPAFGVHGKDDVTVAQVLGHRSRVPGWSEEVSVETLLDLEASEALLAAEQPWYGADDGSAYQLVNHGHLLDAIVHGATGRRLAEVLRDDVVEPLGGGFHLGVPDEVLEHCADLIPPTRESLEGSPVTDFLMRTIANPLISAEVCNEASFRQGAVGGMNGHGTALGIARTQAVVSHGGEVDGVRLLSPATIERIFEVQADGTDQLLGVPLTFGTGWALPTPSAPAVPEGRVCWWTGFGGAIVVNDLDHRATFAYAPARMEGHVVASARTDAYLRAAVECVENG